MKDIEVDEQSNPAFCELQIRDELCAMDWGQRLYCLDLQDDLVFDENIYPVSHIEQFGLVIDHRYGNLGFNLQTNFPQFMHETSFVGTLE